MTIELRDRLAALRSTRRIDARAGAAALQVPEARLLAAQPHPDRVRLGDDWTALVDGLAGLGPLQLHTDSRLGVHRVQATVDDVRARDGTARLRGETAELRLLLRRWASGWAVVHDPDGFAEPGLHIYDAHGDPVLRVLLSARTDRSAFRQLVARLRADRQDTPLPVRGHSPLCAARPVSPEAQTQLLDAWPHLRDARQLGHLLRRTGLRRPEAYAWVAPHYARPLARSELRQLLDHSARAEVMLALSLANRACVQTHHGLLDHVSHPAGWLAVHDPCLFLLLDPGAARSIWLVRRPSAGGMRLHVELIGHQGDVLGSIRSTRPLQQPEDPAWQAAVDALPARSEGARAVG